jgi:hypothetical protein
MWTDLKYKLLFWWMAFFLRFAYLTGLRQWWNRHCQKKFDKKCGTSPLPTFTEPTQIWEYLRYKFQYRKDPKDGMLDYFSEPEKFHWRFLRDDIPDGDCDDVARFVAAVLFPIQGVQTVYVLHTGFRGGAHATVVFKQNDKWWHFNYGLKSINNPNEAIQKVVDRHTKKGEKKEITYWCAESYNMYPVAICPKKIDRRKTFKDFRWKIPPL